MANRYWVGGSATWDGTAGSKWSLTSGGAGGQAVPTTSDDVFFDAASGAVSVAIGAAVNCRNIDFTGFTGTLTHGSFTATCAGTTFKLVSGMTYAPSAATQAWAFTATGGTTLITTAGKTLGNVTVNGVGGTFQLQDNLTIRSDATLGITNGHFDANDFNFTGGSVGASNSNVRTISMGNGTWTLNGAASLWTTFTATNLTLNAEGSTIVVPNTAAPTGRSINGNSAVSLNDIVIEEMTDLALVRTLQLTAVVCADFTLHSSNILVLSGTALTVTGDLTLVSDVDGPRGHVRSATVGTYGTVSKSSGSVQIDGFALLDVNCTGGATFTAVNSFDLGHTAGITITESSGGGSGAHIAARQFLGM